MRAQEGGKKTYRLREEREQADTERGRDRYTERQRHREGEKEAS